MTTEIKEIRKELEILKNQTRQLLNDFNKMMRKKSEPKKPKTDKKYKDPRSEKELKEISEGAEMTTHMKINLTSHDKSVFF